MNIGTIEMFVPLSGIVTYTVTLTVYYPIGQTYPATNQLTYAQHQANQQILINKGILPGAAVLSQQIIFNKVTKNNIKNILFDNTGNAQIPALKNLDLIYNRGFTNLTTQFAF